MFRQKTAAAWGSKKLEVGEVISEGRVWAWFILKMTASLLLLIIDDNDESYSSMRHWTNVSHQYIDI